MAILDLFYNFGGMLRIVQPARTAAGPDTAAGPLEAARIETRNCTLAELMHEMGERNLKAVYELPPELSTPFNDIFAAAQVVTPAHGWNVETLRDLLAKEPYCALSGEALPLAVLGCLGKDAVLVEDLIKDAVGRDQAIDAFEEFARDKLRARNEQRRRKIEGLRAEMAALERHVRLLEGEEERDRHEWREWHLKKADYEKMMAATLSSLLDTPVVTLDPESE